MTTKPGKRPFALIVRDGWGANPYPQWNHANAVHLANTPVDDRLMTEYPHTLIATCGEDVGLPPGVMGNSEVGHQNIGAGRIVDQELLRISKAMQTGDFFNNPVATKAFQRAKERGGNVHLLGLCSDTGVHSILEHLYKTLEMANRLSFLGDRVFLHAFMDGRDSPPTSGADFIRQIEQRMSDIGVGKIATVIGRYYAMDRDNRWDRVEKAYRLLTEGIGRHATSATEAVTHYYDHPSEPTLNGDEFITPTAICDDSGNSGSSGDPGNPRTTIRDGDSLIFFNIRGDRPREITRAFTFDTFPYQGTDKDGTERSMGFHRDKKLDLYYATMTAYEANLPVNVIFEKPLKMKDIFGEYIARAGLTQFRCAETEKFPHVTFFFNDYRDDPFPGEDRAIIASPRDVSTYDQKPEMSARQVTETMLEAIASNKYDVFILNYANGDMVGHTGNIPAATKAVETVDTCVGRIVEAIRAKGGSLIITADHGNCEQMIDPETGNPHTSHTTYPVEVILVDDALRGMTLRTDGRLADLAPTALHMMNSLLASNLPKPQSMTGSSLIPSVRPGTARRR